MRILLLGGTGAIGSHLSKILSESGENVTVTSRNRSGAIGLIEFRKGNAKDIHFLKKQLSESWDVIVDFMKYKEDEFRQRVDLILQATKKYIFLSSARVYGNNQVPITEETSRLLDDSFDDDFLTTEEYALSKARQENILFSSEKKHWIIIRPYITYSENRLQLGTLEKENWLYRAIKGRTIVFSKDMLSQFTTMTYGLDVAKGIASLIDKPDALSEAFNITGDYSCTWREIVELYCDMIEKYRGIRPKVHYQGLSEFMEWNPNKFQILYDRLYNRIFDNKKINKFIDTKTFIVPQDGLVKCLEEFLNNPQFQRINWRHEAVKDRCTNEMTPLKEIPGLKQKLYYIKCRYFIS